MKYILIFLLTIFISTTQSSDSKCFRVGSYEHIRVGSPTDNPLKVLNDNFAIYAKVIRKASWENVKIIVLPEYGLFPINNQKDVMLSSGVVPVLPEVGTNFCELYKQEIKDVKKSNLTKQEKKDKLKELYEEETEEIDENVFANTAILRKFSCLAKKHEISIVVDLSTMEKVIEEEEKNTVTDRSDLISTTHHTNIEFITPDITSNNQNESNAVNLSAENNSTSTDSTELDLEVNSTESVSNNTTTTSSTSQETTTSLNVQTTKLEKEVTSTTTVASETTTTSKPDETTTTSKADETTTTSKADETTTTQQSVSNSYKLYNTLLVFDDQGKLIARYRKFHLFNEPSVSTTDKQEISTFENKFGKFGLAICADILFEDPIKSLVEKEKINHLILSTDWFDAQPNLAAVSFHSSVAIKYGINIVTSNRRLLEIGSFGSLIASANTGVRVQSKLNDNKRLLIAELPIGNNTKNHKCTHTQRETVGSDIYKADRKSLKKQVGRKNYKPLETPFELFQSKQLEKTEGSVSVCDGVTCCELDYKMKESFNYDGDDYFNYYLIAGNRKSKSQDPLIDWQEENCSLVIYDKLKKEYKITSSTRFKKLILKGTFNTAAIFPNVLSKNLEVVPKQKWTFKQDNQTSEISFKNLRNSITLVTLYARDYDLD